MKLKGVILLSKDNWKWQARSDRFKGLKVGLLIVEGVKRIDLRDVEQHSTYTTYTAKREKERR